MQSSLSYSKDDLLLCADGQMVGPTGNTIARLPAPDMLMMDRVTVINDEGGEFGKGHMTAELDIHPELWFFGCHFKTDPVMPGCLGVDALWQMAGFFMSWLGAPGKGRALGAGEIKFFGQVLPTAKLVTYQLDVKRIIRRKLNMIIADGRMAVDGKEIYTAKDLKVGLFEKTEDF